MSIPPIFRRNGRLAGEQFRYRIHAERVHRRCGHRRGASRRRACSGNSCTAGGRAPRPPAGHCGLVPVSAPSQPEVVWTVPACPSARRRCFARLDVAVEPLPHACARRPAPPRPRHEIRAADWCPSGPARSPVREPVTPRTSFLPNPGLGRRPSSRCGPTSNSEDRCRGALSSARAGFRGGIARWSSRPRADRRACLDRDPLAGPRFGVEPPVPVPNEPLARFFVEQLELPTRAAAVRAEARHAPNRQQSRRPRSAPAALRRPLRRRATSGRSRRTNALKRPPSHAGGRFSTCAATHAELARVPPDRPTADTGQHFAAGQSRALQSNRPPRFSLFVS